LKRENSGKESLSGKALYELPFDWKHDFVYTSDGTKCLGACALMAMKYWGVEITTDRCQEILDKLSVPAFEGADGSQVVKAVENVLGEVTEGDEDSLETKLDRFFIEQKPLETRGPSAAGPTPLKQEFFHAGGIDALKAAFVPKKPIPQIVIYDEVMAASHEESPGGHACVVQRIDPDTRLVYLIDPNLLMRRTPIYLSFDDFERGWRSFEQLTFLIYPSQLYQTVRALVTSRGLGAQN